MSRLVIAGSGDLTIIRRPGDAIDRLRVTSKRMHQLAGQRIPNAGGRVPTSRDNLMTFGRPGYAMKRVRMGEREQGSTGRRIPNAGSGILACCCDEAVIGRPGGIFDTCRVACQGEQKVTRLSVPNAGVRILVGSSDAEAIRGPGGAPDRPRGIGKDKDCLSSGELAHKSSPFRELA